MSAQVTRPAPDFSADAVVGGERQTIRLSDYRGKYVLLSFYPMDFSFLCPTELTAFSDRREDFAKRGCEVLGVSVDGPDETGRLNYPIVRDRNRSIARSYGVLLEEAGVALRGLFLIDREGVLRHALVNDLPLGRSVNEAVRTLDALQHFEEKGEVCLPSSKS